MMQTQAVVLIDELIVEIALFLCIKQKEAPTCVEALRNINYMRGACRQFRDAIDASHTLWVRMMSLTRRASIQPPPLLPCHPKTMRVFVPLDIREYMLRQDILVRGPLSMYSSWFSTKHIELDYTQVKIKNYRIGMIPKDLYKGRVREWDENRRKVYKKTVKKMNRLCGIKRGAKGITKIRNI